jgi:cyanophycin synthetase
MKIMDLRAFEGRNIHSHRPTVEMIVDLGTYADVDSRNIDGLAEKLLNLIPSLTGHYCGVGRPGGFAMRLREGTMLGHVMEHVALELQALVGIEVGFGRTRLISRPGKYRVVFGCQLTPVGIQAGRYAFQIVHDLAQGKTPPLESIRQELIKIKMESSLGPSTAAIAHAARQRGIPVMRICNQKSLLQLGHGCHRQLVWATLTSATSAVGVDLACDKNMTKQILAQAGLPTPPGGMVQSLAEALQLWERLGPPLVIKPGDGNQGKGVSLNLQTPAQVQAAFQMAKNYSEQVLVEKHLPGDHYRLLVVNDCMVAAAKRLPAQVVGDGRHTIRQLIDITNQDPLRGDGHELPLTKIKIDPIVLMVLARQNLSLDDVPDPQKVVFLRDNANLSTGGTAIDVTEQVHPSNSALAVRAARALGLNVAGVDLVAERIDRLDPAATIIEVNASPGIRMHHYPTEGKPRDAGGKIVEALFPPGKPARIPIVAVTGTNGKTTTARLISHMLAESGRLVGLACTDGIYVGGTRFRKGDMAGPRSARTILQNPTVEAAVLEVARGGLVRAGLGYDESDVGVILNVTLDHVGQDGIATLDELAHVKSLVAEAVCATGVTVLNADDPYVARMSAVANGEVIFFTGSPENLIVHKHVAGGGRAVMLKDNQLVYVIEKTEEVVAPVSKIPITRQGLVGHNVENVLAAAAAGFGLGLPGSVIRSALESFTSNPGRFELYECEGYRVLIDYGHNPAGFEKTCRAARQLTKGRLIGVVGVPGDRNDETILMAGEMAARGLNYLVIKEDADLRGRQPGEVAGLLARGAARGNAGPKDITIVLHEDEAVTTAVQMMSPGDTLIIFYENYQAVRTALEKAMATKEPAAQAVSQAP